MVQAPRRRYVCPYIEQADARCANQLTFKNLSYAFVYCADHYDACPIYKRHTAERRYHEPSDARLFVAS